MKLPYFMISERTVAAPEHTMSVLVITSIALQKFLINLKYTGVGLLETPINFQSLKVGYNE